MAPLTPASPAELYGHPDGTVPATFQVVHMVGWKPDPSQVGVFFFALGRRRGGACGCRRPAMRA